MTTGEGADDCARQRSFAMWSRVENLVKPVGAASGCDVQDSGF